MIKNLRVVLTVAAFALVVSLIQLIIDLTDGETSVWRVLITVLLAGAVVYVFLLQRRTPQR